MYKYVEQYTIKPGDTLYNIAKRFDLLNYQQLLRINPDILYPNVSIVGQTINIPKVVPMSTYLVRRGDTLKSIVESYNIDHTVIFGFPITLDEVLAYNPRIRNPNIIYPGMIILLPDLV